MKKIITLALALLLALAIVACANTQMDGHRESGQESSAETQAADMQKISVDIEAANAYVINAESDFLLYQKNSDEYIAPASTVKMLTALTVLDYCSPDDSFTVGSEIDLIARDSSCAQLALGDTLTVKQLLNALLLPSGNDAAYTLAVNTGKRIVGDNGLEPTQAVQAFVNTMNKKAKKIGTTSSNFTTPDGYDADGQYTTAFDLAQIAKFCLDNSILLEIMGSHVITDTWANGKEVIHTNSNNLINPNSPYYYPNTVGLKTGNSEAAGSCLVSAAYINGQTYICVIMGDSANGRFSDSLTIYGTIEQTLSTRP